MDLSRLGWCDDWEAALAQLPERNVLPARVVSAQRERYRVYMVHGVANAVLSGRLRHASGPGELPVVGDWVAVQADGADHARIDAVLPRRTSLARRHADRASGLQLIAANIDRVFVMSSLNRDFNPRRLERALAMVLEGGAEPVIVLSKLDLCPEPAVYLDQLRAIAPATPVHAVSVLHGLHLEPLRDYLQGHRSVAVIGSSGVGKSTLLNWLCPDAAVETAQVREWDERGRHTTTSRELHVLATGGVVIDTPGMREFGLADHAQGVDTVFDDIATLAARCRFSDCQHRGEPGCAIGAALEAGELAAERVNAHRKLQRELAYEARRRDEAGQQAYQRELRRVMRQRTRAQRTRHRDRDRG